MPGGTNAENLGADFGDLCSDVGDLFPGRDPADPGDLGAAPADGGDLGATPAVVGDFVPAGPEERADETDESQRPEPGGGGASICSFGTAAIAAFALAALAEGVSKPTDVGHSVTARGRSLVPPGAEAGFRSDAEGESVAS